MFQSMVSRFKCRKGKVEVPESRKVAVTMVTRKQREKGGGEAEIGPFLVTSHSDPSPAQ